MDFLQLVWPWFFRVLYSTLLHLPPLRFHCVGVAGIEPRLVDTFGHLQSDAQTTRPLIYSLGISTQQRQFFRFDINQKYIG
jgi:hypothetical protein